MLNFTHIYFQDRWANMAAHSIAQSVAGLTGKIIRRRSNRPDRVPERKNRRLKMLRCNPGQFNTFNSLRHYWCFTSRVSVSLLFLSLSVNGLDTGPLVATC